MCSSPEIPKREREKGGADVLCGSFQEAQKRTIPSCADSRDDVMLKLSIQLHAVSLSEMMKALANVESMSEVCRRLEKLSKQKEIFASVIKKLKSESAASRISANPFVQAHC